MIKIVEGDLLKATENIIGHQVNCQNVMGSGVAKQLRDKYPIIFEGYSVFCDAVSDPSDLLGQIQYIKVAHEKYVANIFGQRDYGRDSTRRYTNYLALEEALTDLRVYAEANNLTVALPYFIGAGLGGGNWDTIYGLISSIFEGYEITLYKF